MDYSALTPSHHQNPLLSKPISFPKPLRPWIPKTPLKPQQQPTLSLSLSPRCSSLKPQPQPQPHPQHQHQHQHQRSPLSSLLRPAAVTLAAAAALFLSRFPNPSLALASPNPTQSQSTVEEEQEQALEAQLDSNPSNPRLLRSLLDLKIKSNKIFDAIHILDRLIELDPTDLDLPLLKSHILIQSGDSQSAKHFIEQVISEHSFSVEAYHGLIMAHREAEESMCEVLQRIENAIEMCKKAKRREDARDFKLLKAEIKVVEGRYEEAIKVYEEVVKEEPRDFRPYLCEGIVYMLMNKKEEAKKQFEKYRRLVPKGHPYAGYFNDSVIAMKVFGQMEENRRAAGLKI